MNLPSDENEPETLAPQAVSHNHGIALPESSWSILSSLDSAALAPSHPMAPLQHPSSPMSRGNEVIHSCSSPRFHAMSAAPREIIPLDDPALFLAAAGYARRATTLPLSRRSRRRSRSQHRVARSGGADAVRSSAGTRCALELRPRVGVGAGRRSGLRPLPPRLEALEPPRGRLGRVLTVVGVWSGASGCTGPRGCRA